MPHAIDSVPKQPRAVSRPIDRSTGEPIDSVAVALPVGEALVIGREGDLPAGVAAEDSGVSRSAVCVSADDDAFEVVVTNRNGAVVHPWAAPPVSLRTGQTHRLRSPRVGIRILGSAQDIEHWILLEADDFAVPMVEALTGRSSRETITTAAPDPLTPAQLAAVRILFAQYLEWPPVSAPTTTKVAAAARQLGISVAGVTDRMNGVLKKAQQLGSPEQTSIVEPSSVYVLAAHGYLVAPTATVAAVELD